MADVASGVLYNFADTIGYKVRYDAEADSLSIIGGSKVVRLAGINLPVMFEVVCHTAKKRELEVLCKVAGNLFVLVNCQSERSTISVVNFAKIGCTSKDFVANRDHSVPMRDALKNGIKATFSRLRPTAIFKPE